MVETVPLLVEGDLAAMVVRILARRRGDCMQGDIGRLARVGERRNLAG